MFETWQRANQSERNGLQLIIGIVALVVAFGIVEQITAYTDSGQLPYPIWRYGLWLLSAGVYLIALLHHAAHGEKLEKWQFVWRLCGTALLAALVAYLMPETPSWLLIAPLASDMWPHFQFPQSLPLYLFLLICMVLPAFGLPSDMIDWQTLISIALQFSIVIAFVAVFSGLQRQIATEKAKLEQANLKLAAYAEEVEELATTKERNRLAREIHDNLGHYLTVVNVQLEAGKLLLERNPEKARAALEKAQRLTQEGLQAVRDSVSSLRESALNKPLEQAIGVLIENERVSGISADYQLLGTPTPLDPKTTLTLYRTVQEALTNIRKHAHATQIDVTLDYRSAENIYLSIQDNGKGSDNPSGGFGLVGIQERINLLDGTLAVETKIGSGFLIQVSLPRRDQ